MKKETLIKIIYVVLVAVFAVSAFNIGRIYYGYSKADNTYAEIQNEYIERNNAQYIPESETDKENIITKANETPVTVDFGSLINRNKDVIGWLYCPDTVINYPVVQGEDNDRYLRKGIDGEYLVSGTLFADYRNGKLSEDANFIIYGHNMKNDTMFGMLTQYKQQSFYDQHPIMYYLTPDADYKIELFAGLVIKRDDEIYLFNKSKTEFSEMINGYREKSTFISDVELEYNDIIVTLSTCSYEFDNARFVVIGRLIPA